MDWLKAALYHFNNLSEEEMSSILRENLIKDEIEHLRELGYVGCEL